jgi:hypothetical protein
LAGIFDSRFSIGRCRAGSLAGAEAPPNRKSRIENRKILMPAHFSPALAFTQGHFEKLTY